MRALFAGGGLFEGLTNVTGLLRRADSECSEGFLAAAERCPNVTLTWGRVRPAC
jgi:hypothetical protein